MKFKKMIVWLSVILIWFIITIPALGIVSDVVVPQPHRVFISLVDFIVNGYGSTSFWSHIIDWQNKHWPECPLLEFSYYL